MLLLFPDADLYSLVDHLPKDERKFLRERTVNTSFVQDLPFSAKLFRNLLWLLPSAIESLDVSEYDLVLSSSHSVAKGILTGPDQVHICYCHSPIRYAWDLQHQYLRQAGLQRGFRSIYARATLHYLRMWDLRTTPGVDHFLANSSFIARRIEKIYRRDSTVVHPPVEIDAWSLEEEKSDYYFTASRLVPYKRVDLLVKAFAKMPNRKLIVVGHGSEMAKCKKEATANVELLGFQRDDQLRPLMQKARAFLFAAEEDFGITVVEAQAAGTPVICLGRGGVLDSVIPGVTGLYFQEQTTESIVAAVEEFENSAHLFDAKRIRWFAERFSPQAFRRNFLGAVETQWNLRQNKTNHQTNLSDLAAKNLSLAFDDNARARAAHQ